MGGKIKYRKVSCVFENDAIVAKGRKFDVVIGIIGQFTCCTRFCVIDKEIHGAVAVGAEINIVAMPHRENILIVVISDVCNFFGIEIINPDIISHTAFVIFPGAEFAENAVER